MVDCVEVFVLADVQERLLCFQYLPKGSVDKKITYAPHRHEWRRRYQIMKGISVGLHYFHRNKNDHLDLQPTNILLDYDVMSKIADYSLSRCFNKKQSWTITSNLIGTMGYIAPELYVHGKISFKSNTYSLGVIIMEIITGKKGYGLL